MSSILPSHIIAVGHLKNGPEHDLFTYYHKRLSHLTITEIKPSSKEEEGRAILSALKKHTFVIALDERGRDIKSTDFAHMLCDKLQTFSTLTFIIGGADGLSQSVKDACPMLLRFGSMTWPHMMVRGMLCEQIYRATLILNHHPYHRE